MRNSSCQQPNGFHLLRLTELCLQAPSSSNVFHNDFEVAERAILYAESPSAYTNDDDLAVFAFPIDFTPAHAPAGPVAVKNRPAIGRNLIDVAVQVPRQQFLFCAVTQHGYQGWVYVQQSSVQSGSKDTVGCVFEQFSIFLFGLSQRLL